MKTDVTILHHDYPPRVAEYADERLQQLAKYFDRALSLHAVIALEREEHRVELVATVPRGQVLKVELRAASFGEALDGACERMTRQLSETKQKLSKVARRKTRAALA